MFLALRAPPFLPLSCEFFLHKRDYGSDFHRSRRAHPRRSVSDRQHHGIAHHPAKDQGHVQLQWLMSGQAAGLFAPPQLF